VGGGAPPGGGGPATPLPVHHGEHGGVSEATTALCSDARSAFFCRLKDRVPAAQQRHPAVSSVSLSVLSVMNLPR